ncbi:hypothetical protein CORC01_11682 [Colletotrichum orchidophilum]|uniref:Uncharacterized protein n=1 Tax=Colletotrichum orchidophilum TaxID=1209926 RepID=A0A1G4AVF4_9PEZI|nr:uncharacterized protein CORC01_11682 [Colletotrichum orchidophilum]OHE93043.1 hypothetical protein CORC01_11682 [Colletotrichum orchidophilum]
MGELTREVSSGATHRTTYGKVEGEERGGTRDEIRRFVCCDSPECDEPNFDDNDEDEKSKLNGRGRRHPSCQGAGPNRTADRRRAVLAVGTEYRDSSLAFPPETRQSVPPRASPATAQASNVSLSLAQGPRPEAS